MNNFNQSKYEKYIEKLVQESVFGEGTYKSMSELINIAMEDYKEDMYNNVIRELGLQND